MLGVGRWMSDVLHRPTGVAVALMLLASSLLSFAASLPARHAAPPEVGQDLLNTRPSAWTFNTWLNSPPLELSKLRGKVVLIRWWTAPGCPYCAASADALENWWRKYRDQGLVVIGAYHHKSDTPLTREHVASESKRLGFTFPVAIDRDWKTLHHWWLDRTDRGWTSVTFLIDRTGTIRFIHGGGAYLKGDPGYESLEHALIDALNRS
jgi:peroxiredoxin